MKEFDVYEQLGTMLAPLSCLVRRSEERDRADAEEPARRAEAVAASVTKVSVARSRTWRLSIEG